MLSATTMPGTRYALTSNFFFHMVTRLLLPAAPATWMACMHVLSLQGGEFDAVKPLMEAVLVSGGVVPPQLLGSQPQRQQDQALLRRGAL